MAIHVDPPRRPRFREKDETTSYLDGLWSWLYQLAEKLNAQQDAPAPVTQVVNNYGGRGGGGNAKLEPTGDSTHPIYIDEDGKAAVIDRKVPAIIRVTVNITNTQENEHTFNLPDVTEDMVVLAFLIGNPAALNGDVVISTGNGTLAVTGDFSGQTSLTITLG